MINRAPNEEVERKVKAITGLKAQYLEGRRRRRRRRHVSRLCRSCFFGYGTL
jgi:hypothetical protein